MQWSKYPQLTFIWMSFRRKILLDPSSFSLLCAENSPNLCLSCSSYLFYHISWSPEIDISLSSAREWSILGVTWHRDRGVMTHDNVTLHASQIETALVTDNWGVDYGNQAEMIYPRGSHFTIYIMQTTWCRKFYRYFAKKMYAAVLIYLGIN